MRARLFTIASILCGCAQVLGVDKIDIGDAQGAGGGGASSSAGGGAPMEDCSNGKDDDQNGLTDCKDPACGGFACLALPAMGWSGPLAASFGATADKCPPGFVEDAAGGFGQLTVPAPTCTMCSCGKPVPASCQLERLQFYSLNGCGGNVPQYNVMMANKCEMHGFASYPSVRAKPINVDLQNAKCDPDGGVATLPPASFATAVRLCHASAPASGGCGASESCLPSAGSGWTACISSPGDVPCPSGPYGKRTVISTGVDDTRKCTPCTCAPPVGVSCSGKTMIYVDTGCATLKATLNPDNSCVNAGSQSLIFMPDPPGGSCAVMGGGQATGGATPKGTTTVCCLP